MLQLSVNLKLYNCLALCLPPVGVFGKEGLSWVRARGEGRSYRERVVKMCCVCFHAGVKSKHFRFHHLVFAITSFTAVRIFEIVFAGSFDPNIAVPATKTFDPVHVPPSTPCYTRLAIRITGLSALTSIPRPNATIDLYIFLGKPLSQLPYLLQTLRHEFLSTSSWSYRHDQ